MFRSRLTETFHASFSTLFADYSQKEVCDMSNMEPAPLWELFCLTGEPLAYMLYRSAEPGSGSHWS